ncbi:ThiF family adenylyltransferase [Cetobacterium sp. 2A]|uniref:HesA/MoeB/ThiF family protein n=1 Tax=Cetobacterium sp. 2A TaxID=2754723 RepID=UPI00163C3329|nr:ThiF family adenylyltransferase [Cetobacterium sp. 2A]MBC2857171.1 ThiF family adenylyltransferase [Cetobacterium sp. 2A]
MKRYLRNLGTLNSQEQEKLKHKKVLIIGMGGLGGDIIDGLARFGIGYLRIIDFDRFELSNLNRQLLASEDTIGKLKIDVAKIYIEKINSKIVIDEISLKVTEENINKFFKDMDLVIDCTDNIETKILIEKYSQKYNINLIYGAVGGWYGNVAIIYPKSPFLKDIYSNFTYGIEKKLGTPRFTVSMVASIQLNLAIKSLLNKQLPDKGFFYIDMRNLELEWIKIGS